jgi:hypothetical protein
MDETGSQGILQRLRECVEGGDDWYAALMQAVRDWPLAEEEVEDERFVYLLDGEALDLLRLCERLALVVEDLVPEPQLMALLANDRPPEDSAHGGLKSLIGPEKYRAYLTFIYGVLVEEMVVHAVLEDLRKRHRTTGRTHYDADLDDAYIYVYGRPRNELLEMFRKEKAEPRRSRMTLTRKKEFTFWLFKLRLRSSDKSRVASDTKRALTLLHRYTAARRPAFH